MPLWLQIVAAAFCGALLNKWIPDLVVRTNAAAKLEQRVQALEEDLRQERVRNDAQDTRLINLEVTLARIEGKVDALLRALEAHGLSPGVTHV